eukprot:gene1118-1186_t
MNIHTFKDAVTSKRTALADEIDDDDEDDERDAAPLRRVVEGEEDEGKEKYNEMGVPIEPFNLRNERDSGYFDENMNYVFKKEKGEVDAWLAGLDEATVEAAIGEAAVAEKKLLEKRKHDEEEEAKKPIRSTQELKEELLSFMLPSEKIATTLRRLSGKSSETSNTIKRRTQKNHDDTENGQTDGKKKLTQKEINEISKKNRPRIDRVTEIADELIANGLSGIYGMSYEAIYASTVLWEYKGADEVIYGPYTSQQIAEWKSQGYLTGATAVMIRKAKPKYKAQVSFSMFDDEDESTSTQPTKKAKIESVNEDEWKNSDEIDFGSFINLDSVEFNS